MNKVLVCIVSALVIGFLALPAHAELNASDPFITQLMSIQGELQRTEISLDQADSKLQDLRSEISYIADDGLATSLMVALDSFQRDINALRNRPA